jgi:hypothetical protein
MGGHYTIKAGPCGGLRIVVVSHIGQTYLEKLDGITGENQFCRLVRLNITIDEGSEDSIITKIIEPIPTTEVEITQHDSPTVVIDLFGAKG